jgi:hypothetical protein
VANDVGVGDKGIGVDVACRGLLVGIGGGIGEIGDVVVNNAGSGVAELQEVITASPINKAHRRVTSPWP